MLNTGRQMYHWHTGTMTRRSFALDAASRCRSSRCTRTMRRRSGCADGDAVDLTTRRGSVRINVRVSDRQAKGQVFMPMHFREAAANLLTNPAARPVRAHRGVQGERGAHRKGGHPGAGTGVMQPASR